MSGKNQSISDRLSASEDRRQTIESQFETTGEKIESLEGQVAAAKEIAEESDKKVEEVVRKLMLAEIQRDRAEAKAERNDARIQSKLGSESQTSSLIISCQILRRSWMVSTRMSTVCQSLVMCLLNRKIKLPTRSLL